MSKQSFLSQHSLFTEKATIATPDDLTEQKIEKYGDKIIIDIPLKQIETQPQVRKSFEKNEIIELAEDIHSKGLIHPITIMKHPTESKKYLLLIGGNRYQAYQHLNRKKIPCIIKDYNDNSAQNALLQLAENMHRTDINPIELADALMKIKDETNFTLEQIAKAVGRNLDSIKQYSRISKLSAKEKETLIQQKATKNEILSYLAEKNIPKKKELTNPLFETEALNPYKDMPKDELIKKVKEAENFLKQAKALLK